ncbi:MAG: hypothetical protein KDD66_02595 [Bdellovibrionales bacterium]|nr:hypothetical protein [Bdellovibrionales bacterium]
MKSFLPASLQPPSANNFQQPDAAVLIFYGLVFAASLGLALTDANTPQATIAGYPAMSFWLSCCFVLYGAMTIAAYALVFRHWRN